jgi:integrase
MAGFEQRESGWWQAKIRRKGHPVQSKTFPTKSEAEAWARSVENKMDRGIFVDRAEAESTTLYDALARYEREVTAKKKSKARESARIKVWQQHRLAAASLAALRASDFSRYRDERLADGMAPASVRLELSIVSHLFSIAQKEWGLPVQNPVQAIRMPRADNARNRRLEDDEEAWLLESLGKCRNAWIKPAFVLAIETALRQGELLSLEWKNVDLQRRTARLPDTKNGTERIVPLSTRAVAVLESLPRSVNGRVLQMTQSAVIQSWERVVNRARQAYEKAQAASGVKPKAIEADTVLRDLRWHDLRHEGTSRLAEKLEMHELMKVTGHKDARMVLRYYHPRAEDLALKLG